MSQPSPEFTNNTIDTAQLPRFENVAFRPLEKSYLKVLLINFLIVVAVISMLVVASYIFVSDFSDFVPWVFIIPGAVLAIVGTFSFIGFYKQGFAFREHDVLYKSGVISTNIIIIPYNRVQHVALHEGPFSRIFGLSEIRIYTAGGGSGDIAIPGILATEAQGIKQLLMGKIQKPLA